MSSMQGVSGANTMDKMILCEGAEYTTDSKITGVNNNVMVVGTSGAGKTFSVIEPALLETYNSNVIVTVTKRRVVDMYKRLLEKRGYRILDIDFVDFRRGNAGYDPLDYVTEFEDIGFLAESILTPVTGSKNSSADPYWAEAGKSLLSALIALAFLTKDNPSFKQVLKYYDGLDYGMDDDGECITTSLDKKFDGLKEISEMSGMAAYAVRCWKTFQRLPKRTASCVYSEVSAAMDKVFTPAIRSMISMKKSVDLSQLTTQKTALFITTSPVNPALNYYVNTFYSNIFKKLFEYAEDQPQKTLSIPIRVMCDDFATGSPILNFAEYISIMREKNISVMMMLQSESQLKSIYGEDKATTIINNCDSYVYMGGMDIQTARNISTRINLPVDEVLAIPVGRVFLFRRGQKPQVSVRYSIEKREDYKIVLSEYNRRSQEEDELPF